MSRRYWGRTHLFVRLVNSLVIHQVRRLTTPDCYTFQSGELFAASAPDVGWRNYEASAGITASCCYPQTFRYSLVWDSICLIWATLCHSYQLGEWWPSTHSLPSLQWFSSLISPQWGPARSSVRGRDYQERRYPWFGPLERHHVSTGPSAFWGLALCRAARCRSCLTGHATLMHLLLFFCVSSFLWQGMMKRKKVFLRGFDWTLFKNHASDHSQALGCTISISTWHMAFFELENQYWMSSLGLIVTVDFYFDLSHRDPPFSNQFRHIAIATTLPSRLCASISSIFSSNQS